MCKESEHFVGLVHIVQMFVADGWGGLDELCEMSSDAEDQYFCFSLLSVV
jgi:hypothetical protein